MIPNKEQIKVIDTTHGEKVDMEIDAQSLTHIINVLTDLYEDPEMACIREYSTNGFDSQTEAGVKRPIEVACPSALRPILAIRDFGVGMDAEDIRRTYSKYGASTKRESNDLQGVLGLGSKSALTYTEQFTVKGVKGGMRTLVSVSRSEAGAGVMTILEESKTDEPSGVEINIPCKANQQFKKKALEFFKYWDKGTVLVDGVEPTCIWDQPELMEIAPDTFITKGDRYSENGHVVVMGNVAYPLNIRMTSTLNAGHFVTKRVPIGAVDFTPSREALQETPRTKATVEKIQTEVEHKALEQINKRINEAKDAPEAFERWLTSSEMFNRELISRRHTDLHYRGKKFPVTGGRYGGNRIQIADEFWTASPESLEVRSKESGFGANNMKNVLLVHGFPLKKMTKKHALKLRLYLEGKEMMKSQAELEKKPYYERDNLQAVVMDKKEQQVIDWIDPKRVIAWDDVKIIKVESETANEVKNLGGSYRVYVWENGEQRMKEMTPGEVGEIKNDLFWAEGYVHLEKFFEFFPKATIALLPANRIGKFKRLFPNARKMDEGVKEVPGKVAEKLKTTNPGNLEKQHLIHYVRTSDHGVSRLMERLFKRLPTSIDDPDVKAIAEIAKIKVSNDWQELKDLESWLNSYRVPAILGTTFDANKGKQFIAKVKSVTGRYPLLVDHTASDLKAIETYVNAVYQYNNNKETETV